jgi:hypothetical protein
MDNVVGGEIHQKNDRFKKIEDLREAQPSTTVPCHQEVGKSISGYRRRGRET